MIKNQIVKEEQGKYKIYVVRQNDSITRKIIRKELNRGNSKMEIGKTPEAEEITSEIINIFDTRIIEKLSHVINNLKRAKNLRKNGEWK